MLNPIQTARLTLRDFTPSDADDLHAYLSDPDVVRFEPYKPYSPEQSAAEAVRRSTDERFVAVCLDGRVIGNIFISREQGDDWEIGYVFNRAYWGRGYACEAAAAVRDYVFRERGAMRLIAKCDPRNRASWRLMERLGMRRIEELKQNVYFFVDEAGAPIWHDTYVYELTKEEWEKLYTN